MDLRSHATLELPLVLQELAGFTSFSASKELALGLEPRSKLARVEDSLRTTSEARGLLDARKDVTIGGARDVRRQAERARQAGLLEPDELLDIQATLRSARRLKRLLTDEQTDLLCLKEAAEGLLVLPDLIAQIASTVDDNGKVRDQASPELARIRGDLLIAQDRLTTRLQRMLSDSNIAPMLQDAIITQRDGRYVLPLKAEFKGKIKAVVHDRSSSGATIFVEPLEIVEANNHVRELELAERDEVRRILRELSARVGDSSGEIIATVNVLAALDLAFAKARFAEHLDASKPIVRDHAGDSGSGRPLPGLRLKQARHPLLEPGEVVPIDLVLENGTLALVITGPNTGGKTVALKTAGLLTLMAQCGMHIPAESGSELALFEAVYADIGDEQSIEQSLSTFSAHVTNIIRILQDCGPGSLVLLDELGAGTDPSEGAALARAILEKLVSRRCTTLVATHYPELKIYAHHTPGVQNASVEFDLETLAPTYHLEVGLPGRSNALAIARRLGLSEDIIARASSGISHTELEADELLEGIRTERKLAQGERDRAEQLKETIAEERRLLNLRLRDIEDERRELLEQAQKAAKEELEAFRREVEEHRSILESGSAPQDSAEDLLHSINALEERIERMAPADNPQVLGLDRPVRVGDRVHVLGLDSEGIVREIVGNTAELQLGNLRMRADLGGLIPLEASGEEFSKPQRSQAPRQFEVPGTELDLRGRSAEEAIIELDRHLDAAYMAELPTLRVIHGKGRGVLREAVRAALQGNPYIESFRPGEAGEGGSGVTIIRLRRS